MPLLSNKEIPLHTSKRSLVLYRKLVMHFKTKYWVLWHTGGKRSETNSGFLTMTFLQWFDIIDHANLLTSFCGSKYLPKIWLNKMMISVFSRIRAIQMFWLNKYIFAIYRRLENTSTYIFRQFFTHRMFIY